MSLPTISEYCNKQPYLQRLQGGLRVNGSCIKDFESRHLLVTLITVVFNAEQSLESTILSVINQSYKNIEYIIIDGGSTDNTLKIISKYEKYIDYWISEPDKGIYDAMNKGISFSNGVLIGIINAGDIYTEKAVEIATDYYKTDPKPAVYVGNCNCFINQEKCRLMSGKATNFPYRMLPHPSTFIPLSVYQTYGLFEYSFKIAGDYDLLCRFYKAAIPFIYIDEVIVIASIPGLSSNYYLSNIEALKVRLNHKLPLLDSIIISILGFFKAIIRLLIRYVFDKQLI